MREADVGDQPREAPQLLQPDQRDGRDSAAQSAIGRTSSNSVTSIDGRSAANHTVVAGVARTECRRCPDCHGFNLDTMSRDVAMAGSARTHMAGAARPDAHDITMKHGRRG